MRYWKPEELTELWRKDQILYAELSHYYPCCDLPTKQDCTECDIAFNCKLKEGLRNGTQSSSNEDG